MKPVVRLEQNGSAADLARVVEVLLMKSSEPHETGLIHVFFEWALELTEQMVPLGAGWTASPGAGRTGPPDAGRTVPPDAGRTVPPSAGLPPVQTLEELQIVLTEAAEKWPKQWRQKGIEQGVKLGIERVLAHERELLRRQAALRFGAETASRVSHAVERIAKPDGLAAAGEWIVRAETGDELVARLTRHMAPYRPARRYHVVYGHVAEDDLPGGNLMTAVVRLEKSGSAADLIPVVEALRARLSDPREAALRRVFLDWVFQLAERLVPSGGGVPAVRTLDELKMKLVDRVAEWPEHWFQEGVEQGLAQQRALLGRQAALRFGGGAASRVSEAVERIAEPENLAAAGDWLVRAQTGDELVARLMQLAEGRDAA